jgi:hypothetical protein
VACTRVAKSEVHEFVQIPFRYRVNYQALQALPPCLGSLKIEFTKVEFEIDHPKRIQPNPKTTMKIRYLAIILVHLATYLETIKSAPSATQNPDKMTSSN